MLQAQGNLAGAQAAFQRSLEIRRRLADTDPSNAGWQRDLSFSFTNIAQLHEQTGNRNEALRLAQESLEIDERLAALDPINATWRRDVEISRALVPRLREPTSQA